MAASNWGPSFLLRVSNRSPSSLNRRLQSQLDAGIDNISIANLRKFGYIAQSYLVLYLVIGVVTTIYGDHLALLPSWSFVHVAVICRQMLRV